MEWWWKTMSEGWEVFPLEEVLELVIDHRGKTPKKLGGDFTESGVRVISAIHVKDGRIKWDERERYVSKAMYELWMPEKLKEGDVLLTSEAPLGEVTVVPDNVPTVLSQRLFALRANGDRLDSGFLRYFLESPGGQHELLRRASGSTVSGIRQAELRRVSISLPSIPEQRAIAEVLEGIDGLIETNRRLQQDIKRLSWLLFEQASPSEDRPFSEVAHLSIRRTKVSEIRASGPFLGLDCFGTDGQGIENMSNISEVGGTQLRFDAGDCLYGKLRPYFRKVDRPNFDGYCSPEIWPLKPAPGISPEFLEAVVSSEAFTAFAAQGSGGSRMPRADWAHVSSYVVKVPTSESMKKLSEETCLLWEARWHLREESEELTQARDTLLPLLLSGQIVPNTAARLMEGVTT